MRTDNSALSWMRNFRTLTELVDRWLQELNIYNLEVVYRPGRNHKDTDALPVRPCKDCSQQQEIENKHEDDEHEITTKKKMSSSDNKTQHMYK